MRRTRIKSVGTGFENKNKIVYETENGEEVCDESFDYVIVAFPVYHNMIDENLKIDFETKTNIENHEMKMTITYLINGNCFVR